MFSCRYKCQLYPQEASSKTTDAYVYAVFCCHYRYFGLHRMHRVFLLFTFVSRAKMAELIEMQFAEGRGGGLDGTMC